MRSDKQKEASKNNGKTSKGPATPEGKAKSSRNAVLHNLTSGRLALLPNEDPREFHDFHHHYLQRFQPADNVELDLVEKMIAASWRERRILAMETALFDIEMDRQGDAVDQEWEEITPAGRQVLVLFGTTDATAAANLLLRYKAAARRDFASAFRLLRDLQGPRFQRFRGPLPSADHTSRDTEPLSPPQQQQDDPEPFSQTEIALTPQPQSQATAEQAVATTTNRRRHTLTTTRNHQPAPDFADNTANLRNEPEVTTFTSANPPQFLRTKVAA